MKNLKIIIMYLVFSVSSIIFAQSAYLGIYVSELLEKDLHSNNLVGGIKVDSVLSDSPAKKNGLRKNAIIYQLNQLPINNENDFQKAISNCKAHQIILIYALFNNQKKVYKIKLGSRDNLYKELYLYNYIQNPWLFIGIDIEPLNKQLAKYFSVTSGVLVTNIRDHSIAKQNGFYVGDVIIAINNYPINSENDLTRQLAFGLEKQPILVNIIRKKQPILLKLDLTNKKKKSSNNNEDIYIIGPDVYDNELYRYSKEQVNQILKKSNTEIENEIERLENGIEVLKQKIRSSP